MILMLLACGSGVSTTPAKIDSAPQDTAVDTGDTGDSGMDSPPPVGSCDDVSYNPWYGTCADTFFEPCFVPSGECSVLPLQDGATVTWTNAASLSIVLGAGDPPPLTMTLYGVDGSTCATGATREDSSCPASQGKMRVDFTRTSDGAVESWCLARGGGAVEVTCADGTTETAPEQSPGAVSCIFGGDRSCDALGLTTPPPQ